MFDKIKDIIFKIKDYDRLEHDYACILDYITDGRLSKTNYRVEGLYTVIDDILTERDECTRKEVEKEIIEKLQKNQSEVDLEKEIDREWEKCNPTDEGMGVETANIHIEAFDMITRHFYELGLNAKK